MKSEDYMNEFRRLNPIIFAGKQILVSSEDFAKSIHKAYRDGFAAGQKIKDKKEKSFPE